MCVGCEGGIDNKMKLYYYSKISTRKHEYCVISQEEHVWAGQGFALRIWEGPVSKFLPCLGPFSNTMSLTLAVRHRDTCRDTGKQLEVFLDFRPHIIMATQCLRVKKTMLQVKHLVLLENITTHV